MKATAIGNISSPIIPADVASSGLRPNAKAVNATGAMIEPA